MRATRRIDWRNGRVQGMMVSTTTSIADSGGAKTPMRSDVRDEINRSEKPGDILGAQRVRQRHWFVARSTRPMALRTAATM